MQSAIEFSDPPRWQPLWAWILMGASILTLLAIGLSYLIEYVPPRGWFTVAVFGVPFVWWFKRRFF